MSSKVFKASKCGMESQIFLPTKFATVNEHFKVLKKFLGAVLVPFLPWQP
jgi:hypothetical protein